MPLIREPWLAELLAKAAAPLALTSYKLPAQTPPEPGADGPTLAKRILLDLSGRRGQKTELASADPLLAPLSKAILAAGLSPENQAAFLASVAATQVNRSARLWSDLDDGRFQQALPGSRPEDPMKQQDDRQEASKPGASPGQAHASITDATLFLLPGALRRRRRGSMDLRWRAGR